MRTLPFCLLLLLASSFNLGAQFSITSLNRNGWLSWTNGISNATYRVEWAASPSGPWHRFDATNLNSITSTTRSVSVQVPPSNAPPFYRIAWTDAAYNGLYNLCEFDVLGNPTVTGKLWVSQDPGGDGFYGWSDLYLANSRTNLSCPECYYGIQFGPQEIQGIVLTNPFPHAQLELTPNIWDNNVTLWGFAGANSIIGKWTWAGCCGPLGVGTFTATKEDCDPAPRPDPIGIWEYEGWWPALEVTGQISFSLVTNSTDLSGVWDLTKRYDDPFGTHVEGQGSFSNVVVSSNSVQISIPTTNGLFTLAGQMAGDMYVGLWQATWANPAQNGYFVAHRKTTSPLTLINRKSAFAVGTPRLSVEPPSAGFRKPTSDAAFRRAAIPVRE